MTIRSLFDPSKDIYRTIEKVITYSYCVNKTIASNKDSKMIAREARPAVDDANWQSNQVHGAERVAAPRGR